MARTTEAPKPELANRLGWWDAAADSLFAAGWNVDGVRFYERLGYVVRARMPGYFDDEHELIWFDRRL